MTFCFFNEEETRMDEQNLTESVETAVTEEPENVNTSETNTEVETVTGEAPAEEVPVETTEPVIEEGTSGKTVFTDYSVSEVEYYSVSQPEEPDPIDEKTRKNNTRALVSMIFGIVSGCLSVICCFIPVAKYFAWVVAFGIAIAAFILGIVSIKGETTRKPMAISGIILGILFAIDSVGSLAAAIIKIAIGIAIGAGATTGIGALFYNILNYF